MYVRNVSILMLKYIELNEKGEGKIMKTTHDLFDLIHLAEVVTNEAIIQWNEAFPYPLGISPILVLGELERSGPQNSMKLAETLHFTGGAMTNIGNKLVKLELVTRESVEGDRRQTQLAITKAGQDVLEQASKLGRHQRQEMFEVLTEEEVEQYLQINQKLLHALRAKRKERKG